MCREAAPKAFVADVGGQSLVADPAAETLENLIEAAEMCPVGAIVIRDAATGEPIGPN
jgi:ferredoxin